jgi:hypothetical protein
MALVYGEKGTCCIAGIARIHSDGIDAQNPPCSIAGGSYFFGG